ncbi:unnamed protein product [Staurois parvus]|uniref:Uncharacterized protein n=1 Tax=Staurois parvus TaxID=386267 RepID=A0ABN9FVI4_9NEOB|nr:unnamed protein product [Staurois parvus]
MGTPCPCPNSKKPMKKSTRGISWGPLLTLGPQALPEFPNGQSAPGLHTFSGAPIKIFWGTKPQTLGDTSVSAFSIFHNS